MKKTTLITIKKMKNRVLFLLLLLTIGNFSLAQTEKEITQQAKIRQDSICNTIIIHNSLDKKLAKKDYIYTEEQSFVMYNSKKEYAIFQLGKKKGRKKIFLYIKLSAYNACVKKDDVVEIMFKDGSSLQLKNNYAVNCKGDIVIEINRKQIESMIKKQVNSFMIYTFQKDYEFHFSEIDNNSFYQKLICLYNYKI